MKSIKLTALFMSIIFLCSCVAASDEADFNSTSEKYDMTERGDLNFIRQELDDHLSRSYKNISIERARMGGGETMPIYDIAIGGNPNFDFKKVVDRLYADRFDISDESLYYTKSKGDAIDNNFPPFSEPTYYEVDGEMALRTINVMEYDLVGFRPSNDQTLSSYHYSTGNVWGSESGSDINRNGYVFEGNKIYERYDLDFEKIPGNLSFTMNDGEEWGAADAVNFVEDFWNNYLSASDPMSFEYRVKSLIIVKISSESYGYLFIIERSDENGNYFDVDKTYLVDYDAVAAGESFKYVNNLMTWCSEKEIITRYIKDFSFTVGDAANSGDNLLTLGAAAAILSEALAPNIDLELTAELNYVIVCKSYPYYTIWENPSYYPITALTSCEFEIRPYWCFRTDQCTYLDMASIEIYFVDADTGGVSVMKQ